jgi:D-alanyl-D-alanine carboxypeptidase
MTTIRCKKNHRYFILLLIIFALAVFIATKGLYYLTTSKEERDLKNLNYSDKAISLIIENKLDKYLINNALYSKTLEAALTNGQYKDDCLEEYINIKYKNYDNFISKINNLIEIGYKTDEINQVFEKLNENDIDIIINKGEVINNLVSYIDNDYFNIDELDRYINYKNKHTTYDYVKVISYVNMYLDYSFYEHDIKVADPNNLLVICNKYYKLDSNFVPKNLVTVDKAHSYNNYSFQVVPIVKEAFDKMIKDMSKEGLDLYVKSAYRSYKTQVSLYNDYVKAKGKESADTFSARAGYSEHQTGLAIDVCAKDNCDYSRFDATDEYKWMRESAYKYGFIMRYQDDKTNITGYKYESWHYRYVGGYVAKYIYDHDLTFDEYYAMFIANEKG